MSVRLYAVVRLSKNISILPAGLAGERLQLMKSRAGSIVFAEASALLEPTPENLLTYDRIVRQMAVLSDAILPARFGVTAETASDLKKEIGDRTPALRRALDLVAGRVQMTLRVPTGRSVRSRDLSGTSYLKARATAVSPPALSRVRRLVGNLLKAERVETAEMALAVYHLIDRADAAAYRTLVAGLRVSGPFPPYAFVPGIDHAASPGHERPKNKPSKIRPARPRAGR